MGIKFNAKLWKQGNSLLMTIPAYFVKDCGLTEGDEMAVDMTITGNTVVCQCGKVYNYGSEADHECFYAKFTTPNDAVMALELIRGHMGKGASPKGK